MANNTVKTEMKTITPNQFNKTYEPKKARARPRAVDEKAMMETLLATPEKIVVIPIRENKEDEREGAISANTAYMILRRNPQLLFNWVLDNQGLNTIAFSLTEYEGFKPYVHTPRQE